MNRTRIAAIAAAGGFLGTILLANYLVERFGLVSVGFGLTATAGTYAAGLAFVLRDSVQDLSGRIAVVGLIVVGALLSDLVASTAIALASGLAFLLSELADLAVYTPLRSRGYVPAAIASNVVGTIVDSLVFLTVAGFPLRSALPGQVVGKLTVTAVTIALVLAVRGARRHAILR